MANGCKNCLLNGYLDEDIYMVQPEGFVGTNHPRKVCKLQRSIYCLKQASRSWNKRFDEKIKKFSFAQNLDEPCVYEKASVSNVTFLILSKRLIGLGQNAYMDKILKRYKMNNSKRGHIPIQEKLNLNKTQGASTPKEVKRMQNVPYASVVVSIMYAVRCTRPNVAFTQNITSRFQQNPGELHWTAVKNILKHMSRQGASYFITFIDDYSRYGYVYLLKHKHEVFETFMVFKNEVENQLGKKIKALRSDRGGEYIIQEFKDYLKACGIV
nr:hypothetical protein [Tanacetum cinerariifolium]